MASQFPNAKDKLDAPSKKTAFERAKAEAEAKRIREAAETAAVYEQFVKSFDDDGGHGSSSSSRYGQDDRGGGYGSSRGAGGGFGGRGASGPPGRRQYTDSSSSSFRGGGGGIGQGPPGRKRDLDTFRSEGREGRGGYGSRGGYGGGSGGSGLLGFDDPLEYEVRKTPLKSERGLKFGIDDEDEDENDKRLAREQAKPTINMTQLPPKTTKPMILDMLLPYFPQLTIAQISLQHIRASSSEKSSYGAQQSIPRKSASALVTLQSDTAASDIDAAVNGLSSKYLGLGYRLSISRHLSSAVLHSSNTNIPHQANAPFNARQLFTPGGPGGRGGFGSHRGGFAPPSTYNSAPSHQGNKFIVTVAPPKDIKTLKLIHKTVEAVLTSGPEFEALLMAMPAVIADERFFWLWDSKSSEHVYYRWRLWDIITSDGTKNSRNVERSYAGTTITHLFDGGAAWEIPPKKNQKFEFITKLEDFIEDEEYHSSSDEDDDNNNHQAQDSNPSNEEAKTYLGPLRRAKLMHLISRVPTTIGTLRRGDVARVTAFAVDNAYAAEEVVDILCDNVARPAAFSGANPDYEPMSVDRESGKEDDKNQTKEDTTPAKMIALYLISDVLSNSGLGVRNVWRYRQLFDQRLREGKVFEGLADVGVRENWGKLRQEKWRRSISSVLTLWENWNIFPQTSHEAIRAAFEEPSSVAATGASALITGTSGDKAAAVAASASAEQVVLPASAAATTKSRWKTLTVEEEAAQKTKFNPYLSNPDDGTTAGEDENVEDEDLVDEDVDGEAMIEDDEDIDGEPMMEEEDHDDKDGSGLVDGQAMIEDAQLPPEEAEKKEAEEEQPPPPLVGSLAMGSGFGFKFGGGGGTKHASSGSGSALEGRRKRMKAEDMFAADDDEE